MARVPLVGDDDADPIVRPLYETSIAASGGVPDLYRAVANSPEAFRAWAKFAWSLGALKTSPRALRELVVLRVSQLTGSHYAWQHHLPQAIRAGATTEQIDELASWRTSQHFSDEERATFRYVEAFIESGDVDDATFQELAAVMTPASIVDITVTAMWYLGASRVIAALGPFPDAEHD